MGWLRWAEALVRPRAGARASAAKDLEGLTENSGTQPSLRKVNLSS